MTIESSVVEPSVVAALLVGVSAVVLAWPSAAARSRSRAALPDTAPAGGIPAGAAVADEWRRLRAGAWTGRPGTVTAITAALAGLACGLAAGPVASLLAAGYAALAARVVLRGAARRRLAVGRVRALDDLCALAADLRAGLPSTKLDAGLPPAVLRAGLPSTGGSDADRASSGRPDRLADLTAAVWRLAERTGAPAADLVERIEADARAMDRAQASAAAQAAGANATAWLLAALPVGGLALGYGLGVDPLHILLHTPLGAACALGAMALQVAGLAWADRIVGAGVRAT